MYTLVNHQDMVVKTRPGACAAFKSLAMLAVLLLCLLGMSPQPAMADPSSTQYDQAYQVARYHMGDKYKLSNVRGDDYNVFQAQLTNEAGELVLRGYVSKDRFWNRNTRANYEIRRRMTLLGPVVAWRITDINESPFSWPWDAPHNPGELQFAFPIVVNELAMRFYREATVPIGNLDGIGTDGTAWGWTYDQNASSVSINVHFYVDGPAGVGTFAGAVTANLPSSDVTQAYGVIGNHRFAFAVPAQFRNGRVHSLYAYGIDANGNPNTLLTGSGMRFTLGTFVCNPDPSEVNDCELYGGYWDWSSCSCQYFDPCSGRMAWKNPACL